MTAHTVQIEVLGEWLIRSSHETRTQAEQALSYNRRNFPASYFRVVSPKQTRGKKGGAL